ncbi:hypothetical protein Tsubulata_006856 [Turnera subulata]|uniref:SKP1 component dimerisation domain-containing protein n=1 Tax=Turnera subulata TaxID=218843 RepID=A0A9Q0GA71_9ROSI|nr:hypothetical protein Tsubulata_006856 [Turnera subulata]
MLTAQESNAETSQISDVSAPLEGDILSQVFWKDKNGRVRGDQMILLLLAIMIAGRTLSKVVEYCKKHTFSDENKEPELKAWDVEFTKVDQDTLIDVLLASNFLDIKNLLDLVCQTVAVMIKEIRKTFHIKNDYTAEEEEEVRRENQWAFE